MDYTLFYKYDFDILTSLLYIIWLGLSIKSFYEHWEYRKDNATSIILKVEDPFYLTWLWMVHTIFLVNKMDNRGNKL